jgi:hypothetical protein
MPAYSPGGDLRFLAPLEAGEQVVVQEEYPDLVAALALEPVRVVPMATGPGARCSLGADSADQVFLPMPLAGTAVLGEAQRILKPGGTLVFGVAQRRRPRQFGQAGRLPTYSIGEVKKELAENRFSIEQHYGVRDNLQRPALLVPIAERAPTQFFFQQRFIPYSTAGRLLRPLVLLLAEYGPYPLLFAAILFVCRS